jgi:hypothetical protein
MDYVTRQFINLTKKFRKELRPLLSKLDRALDKQTEAIRENTKAKNISQPPAQQVTSTVNLPESVEIHHRKDEAAEQKNYQRLSLFLSFVTFLAVAGYAGLVYFQYLEMINATGVAQTTVNEARHSRLQSERALNATIKQFRLEQRAWLTTVFIQTRIEPASPILQQQADIMGYVKQSAKIENVGKTPASKFRCEFMIIPAKVSEIPRFEYPNWKYTADSPQLFPSEPFNFVIPMNQASGDQIHAEPKPVDRDTLKGIHDGSIVLLVYGIVRYQDVFRVDHSVHICATQKGLQQQPMIVSTTASKACVNYNQIDNN